MTEEEKARKEFEENKANADFHYRELQKCLKNKLSIASKLAALKQNVMFCRFLNENSINY